MAKKSAKQKALRARQVIIEQSWNVKPIKPVTKEGADNTTTVPPTGAEPVVSIESPSEIEYPAIVPLTPKQTVKHEIAVGDKVGAQSVNAKVVQSLPDVEPANSPENSTTLPAKKAINPMGKSSKESSTGHPVVTSKKYKVEQLNSIKPACIPTTYSLPKANLVDNVFAPEPMPSMVLQQIGSGYGEESSTMDEPSYFTTGDGTRFAVKQTTVHELNMQMVSPVYALSSPSTKADHIKDALAIQKAKEMECLQLKQKILRLDAEWKAREAKESIRMRFAQSIRISGFHSRLSSPTSPPQARSEDGLTSTDETSSATIRDDQSNSSSGTVPEKAEKKKSGKTAKKAKRGQGKRKMSPGEYKRQQRKKAAREGHAAPVAEESKLVESIHQEVSSSYAMFLAQANHVQDAPNVPDVAQDMVPTTEETRVRTQNDIDVNENLQNTGFLQSEHAQPEQHIETSQDQTVADGPVGGSSPETPTKSSTFGNSDDEGESGSPDTSLSETSDIVAATKEAEHCQDVELVANDITESGEYLWLNPGFVILVDEIAPVEQDPDPTTLENASISAAEPADLPASLELTEVVEELEDHGEAIQEEHHRDETEEKPSSAIEARGRRASDLQQRSDSIRFIRERTMSRSSVSTTVASRSPSEVRIPTAIPGLHITIPASLTTSITARLSPICRTAEDESPISKFPPYKEPCSSPSVKDQDEADNTSKPATSSPRDKHVLVTIGEEVDTASVDDAEPTRQVARLDKGKGKAVDVEPEETRTASPSPQLSHMNPDASAFIPEALSQDNTPQFDIRSTETEVDVAEQYSAPIVESLHSENPAGCYDPEEHGHQRPVAYTFGQLRFNCDYCNVPCPDTCEGTVICNGCGPNSTTRYCCKDHLFLDLYEHWRVCNLTPLRVHVDLNSLPARYGVQYPAIFNRHHWTSQEMHRQRAWSMHNHEMCDYAIFADYRQSQKAGFRVRNTITPTHLIVWAQNDPLKDIFNRLVNMAFFDNQQIRPLLFLYRLIRLNLRRRGQWTPMIELELCHQFFMEFQLNPGPIALRFDPHLPTEWCGRGGLAEFTQEFEAEYAVLRIWRREHPRRANPWERYSGKGFAQATLGDMTGFGLGWYGWYGV